MAVDLKETVQAGHAEITPGMTRLGGTRIEFTAPRFSAAFQTFCATLALSSKD